MEDSGSFLLALIPLGFIALIWAVIFGAFVLWIWMLIDALKRDFPKSDEKLIWVLVIVLFHWLGAIIYYFVVKKATPKVQTSQPQQPQQSQQPNSSSSDQSQSTNSNSK